MKTCLRIRWSAVSTKLTTKHEIGSEELHPSAALLTVRNASARIQPSAMITFRFQRWVATRNLPVRVFVSSTFKDMHAERDELARHVFLLEGAVRGAWSDLG